ncbi:MAG: NAD(+)/NADH kinase [Lachnospiraceae bacterium]|nr:NAD(+)/NADH kinase [Lachnospiraceae bacterium]
MQHFYVITNDIKDKEFTVTGQIENYLKEQGRRCTVRSAVRHAGGEDYHYTDASQIPEDVDCIIVLGGDGTLLQAARDLVDRNIPLLGINLGTLGYLAEIDRNKIIPALDQMIRGDYTIERRMMLQGTVYHKGKQIARDLALNDIVISREGMLRVVNFLSYVNGSFLTAYKADGIIISTPTGSTGYSLSAGGPIVAPGAYMLLMTPLAPHTLNTRSIVFSPDDKIVVEIGPGRDGSEEKGMAFFDGDTSIRLVTGDRIEIERAQQDTQIVKISNRSFLETLRKKMSVN